MSRNQREGRYKNRLHQWRIASASKLGNLAIDKNLKKVDATLRQVSNGLKMLRVKYEL